MKVITRIILFSVFLLIASTSMKAGVVYTQADSLIFNKYIQQVAVHKDKPMSELVIESAKFFLDVPYVAHTLEVGDKENLIVNLRELDCTTFVENCIALSQVIKSEDHSWENYIKLLAKIRYRNGVVDGYPSRLHYISDWKHEHQEDSILTDITSKAGGKRIVRPINYMSAHSNAYKRLKGSTEDIEQMKAIEKAVNERNSYYVLAKKSIPTQTSAIKDGDIVVFATNVAGLDYSHIGFAYHVNGKLHFVHASSIAKKVVIDKQTLSAYCNSQRSNTGVSIFRLND